MAREHIEFNVADGFGAALPSARKAKKHHPALLYSEVGAALEAITGCTASEAVKLLTPNNPFMHDWQSLARARWECKCHVVVIPKHRRKVPYGQLRRLVGRILRELCEQRGVELIEDKAMAPEGLPLREQPFRGAFLNPRPLGVVD